MIPFPDGFDMSGLKPGDPVTVQVEGKVSLDGKGFMPMMVDGHKLSDAMSDDKDMPDDQDDDSDVGDKWQEMFGRK